LQSSIVGQDRGIITESGDLAAKSNYYI